MNEHWKSGEEIRREFKDSMKTFYKKEYISRITKIEGEMFPTQFSSFMNIYELHIFEVQQTYLILHIKN